MSNADTVETKGRTGNNACNQEKELPCLVERRLYEEACSRSFARALTIDTGQHAEAIMAGRNVGIACDSADARLHPILVEPFKHVAELKFLRGRRTRSSKLKFQSLLAMRDGKLVQSLNGRFVRPQLLDQRGKWKFGGFSVLRIHSDHTFQRRKPKPAVPALPSCRLEAAVTLVVEHSVLDAIGGDPCGHRFMR